MAIFARWFLGVLLCSGFSASAGQDAALNSGSAIFYILRLFCAPTNATGFITTAQDSSATTQKALFPGRFWMNENCAVWQLEFGNAPNLSAAQKKRLRDWKLDQVRYVIPMNSKTAYVLYPHAKTYIEIEVTKPRRFPASHVRFPAGEKLPEGVPFKELPLEMYNGHMCRKYEMSDGGPAKMTFWLSKNHRDFPIKIVGEKPDVPPAIYTFTNVDFEISDPSIFEVPKDFTLCKSEEEVKQRQERAFKK